MRCYVFVLQMFWGWEKCFSNVFLRPKVVLFCKCFEAESSVFQMFCWGWKQFLQMFWWTKSWVLQIFMARSIYNIFHDEAASVIPISICYNIAKHIFFCKYFLWGRENFGNCFILWWGREPYKHSFKFSWLNTYNKTMVWILETK